MTDTIIGCPHEEGIDYQGPTCPVCYTNLLLKGKEYYHCCHSNLTRALAVDRKLPLEEEVHVHDVMNIFMCTGYTRDTHQYFMKASHVPPAIS